MASDFNTNPRYIFVRNLKNYETSKFTFKYSTETLKTKSAKNRDHNIQFQLELYKHLINCKRRTYKIDVAIEIDIQINQPNAPSIHNLCKNYIDLICKILPESKIKRKSLILEDDLQIKYLNVNYNENRTEKSCIKFQIFSYNLFLERIKLVKWFNFYHSDYHDDLEESFDGYIHDESLKNYYEHINHKKNLKLKEYDEFWEYSLKRKAQETFLHNNRIKNKNLVDLYYPNNLSQHNLYLKFDFDFQDFDLEDFVFELNKDTFDLDFGNLPKHKGEGNEYTHNILVQLEEYLSERKFLSPILTPISLSILTRQGAYQHKDLDNIGREIIKIIFEKLKPPTNIWNSMKDLEIEKFEKSTVSSNLGPFYKNTNFPKEGFISFKVIYLPPNESRNDNFVRLNIHDSKIHYNFQGYLHRKLLQMSKYGKFS